MDGFRVEEVEIARLKVDLNAFYAVFFCIFPEFFFAEKHDSIQADLTLVAKTLSSGFYPVAMEALLVATP